MASPKGTMSSRRADFKSDSKRVHERAAGCSPVPEVPGIRALSTCTQEMRPGASRVRAR